MKNNINFTTLFIQCPNIGLAKDVGQIPYNLYKQFGVKATLVSSEIDFNGAFINEVEGLDIKKINKIFGNDTLTGIIYLLKNSKNIDVLNLYHCRKSTYIFERLFKLLNSKGKVYVKLDAGNKTIDDILNNNDYKRLFMKIVKYADLITAESRIASEKLSNLSQGNVKCIPNGTQIYKDDMIDVQRENLFITVGRIGAPEKNNELLIDAFKLIYDKCNWNLMFIGDCEKKFLGYYNEVLKNHPYLSERIILHEPIYNRLDLFSMYKRSMVFVLPSKFENFSLACVEAIVNGCYLVLSDTVTPYMDFTNYLKFGRVCKVDDKNDLAEKMLEAIKVVEQSSLSDEISQYGKNNFSWDVICKKIYEELKLG